MWCIYTTEYYSDVKMACRFLNGDGGGTDGKEGKDGKGEGTGGEDGWESDWHKK